jgi:peptidoglycan biosynthesis protein MviN/MurJ (putative lipid II flippase)
VGLLGYAAVAPLLVTRFGAPGLAAAFSGYTYLVTALFLWGLRRDLRPVAASLAGTLARTVASSVALGALCAALAQLGAPLAGGGLVSRAVLVSLLALAGIVVYAVSMTALTGRRGRPVPQVAVDA